MLVSGGIIDGDEQLCIKNIPRVLT